MAAVIVDAAPLFAAANRSDYAHSLAVRLLSDLAGPLLVSTPVLTEAEYLIRTRVSEGAAVSLLADTAAGQLTHIPVDTTDLDRVIAVIGAHPGLELGFADACIVAQAERLKIKTIFTFDHKDFRRIRPAHIRAFELIPSEAELARLKDIK